MIQRLIAECQDLVDFYDRIKYQGYSGFNVWVGKPICREGI